MRWQSHPSVLLLFVAAVLSATIAAYGVAHLRTRDRNWRVRSLVVLTLAVAVWTGVHAIQVASVDLGTKLLAYKLLHVGAVTVPPAYLVFALAYSGREDWIEPRTLALLVAIPVALLLALPTNPHELVIVDARLETVGAFVTLAVEDGPLYRLFLAYGYVMVLAASGIIAVRAVKMAALFQGQAALALTGALLPLVVNVLYVLDVFPPGGVGVNPTASSLSLSSILFALAAFRYRVLDFAPIAHETVLRTVGDAVIVLDTDGRIVVTNDSARSLFEPSKTGSLVGKRAADVLPERLIDLDWEAEVDGVECCVDTREGKRWMLVRHTPILDGMGERGDVLCLTDVTKLERQRTALERQNEQLDGFANVVSHDLRNPLTVAEGRLELARETGESTHFDAVATAHERMEAIIEDVLELARNSQSVDDAGLEPVSLQAVAKTCWDSVATGDVTFRMDGDLTFCADRGRLGRVFENLYRNAVEHGSTSTGSHARQDAVEHGSTSPPSPRKGVQEDAARTSSGEPSLADAREDAVEHGSTSPDSHARQDAVEHGGDDLTVSVGPLADGTGFYVEDDGHGIPSTAHVFEPGYSTGAKGTGFGLPIVEEIVAAHGWEIAVTDGRDGGARFEISGIDRV